MILVVGKLPRLRALVVPAALLILLGSAALARWEGPAPTPHQVTRDMALKIAMTHLLEPGEYQQAHTQAKLVRRWQLALFSRNEPWSDDLIWLVLVPGGHFSAAGSCCNQPKFSWNIAITNDDGVRAALAGVVAGSPGDGPTWYGLLPHLSGGGQ